MTIHTVRDAIAQARSNVRLLPFGGQYKLYTYVKGKGTYESPSSYDWHNGRRALAEARLEAALAALGWGELAIMAHVSRVYEFPPVGSWDRYVRRPEVSETVEYERKEYIESMRYSD